MDDLPPPPEYHHRAELTSVAELNIAPEKVDHVLNTDDDTVKEEGIPSA